MRSTQCIKWRLLSVMYVVRCVSSKQLLVFERVNEMLLSRMNGFFSPPLHLQRHQFVIEFVKKSRPRTVTNLNFFR